MAPNHKLTGVIKGRTISGTSSAGDVLTVFFTDGSKMTVKTAGNTNTGATGGTVKGVRQSGTDLIIEFDDDEALALHTASDLSQ